MSIDATVDAPANPSAGQTAAGFPHRRLAAREPVTQTGTVTRSAVSMPVPATDSDLIDAIADRNRDALEVVFVEYSPALYSLGCRMCGPTLAGEIVATVFVNLWTRPSQFQPAALLGQHHAAIARQICSGLRRLREPVAPTGPAFVAPVGILQPCRAESR